MTTIAATGHTTPTFDRAADQARDARHRAWLKTYQAADTATAQAALAALATDIEPVLRGLARDQAALRFRESGIAAEAAQEGFAAMWAALPAAAARFDEARCAAFLPWFIARSPGPGRQAMYDAFDEMFGMSGLGPRERRALSVANTALSELTADGGQEPSTAALQAKMWELAFAHELRRMSESERRLDEDEQLALARARIVNNSLQANIGRIEDLRRAAERSPSLDMLPIDPAAGEAVTEDEAGAGELLGVALGGARVALLLEGGPELSKAESGAARERLTSAHGQYAFLSPDVLAQIFEFDPAEPAAALV